MDVKTLLIKFAVMDFSMELNVFLNALYDTSQTHIYSKICNNKDRCYHFLADVQLHHQTDIVFPTIFTVCKLNSQV